MDAVPGSGSVLTDHLARLLSFLGAWERPTAAWAGASGEAEALVSESRPAFILSCGHSFDKMLVEPCTPYQTALAQRVRHPV